MAAVTSTLAFCKQEHEVQKEQERLSGFESGLLDEETERMERMTTTARFFPNNIMQEQAKRLSEDHGVAASTSTEVHDWSWALLRLQRLVNRRTITRHRWFRCFGWQLTIDSHFGSSGCRLRRETLHDRIKLEMTLLEGLRIIILCMALFVVLVLILWCSRRPGPSVLECARK